MSFLFRAASCLWNAKPSVRNGCSERKNQNMQLVKYLFHFGETSRAIPKPDARFSDEGMLAAKWSADSGHQCGDRGEGYSNTE
ncbi:hypothetical protein [Mesorhizobium sp. LjRoot246]|uniref:hypothetical protein n=1 Tax=Mesorhizobium sp. LjRoot246 TaxID=3342294 RepID=UPI003ECE479D